MFIPLSVGGRGVGVGGSVQCTIVWGGKLFISTQFSVAESVFCLSFKFWLNFRFFKIRGFDLIIFFVLVWGKLWNLYTSCHILLAVRIRSFRILLKVFWPPQVCLKMLPKQWKSEVNPRSPYCLYRTDASARSLRSLSLGCPSLVIKL